MKRRIYAFSSIAIIACIMVLVACEKDKKDSAPLLPPVSAFEINVEDFTETPPAKITDPQSNFHGVVAAVAYWNTNLSLALFIPVAAYKEAFNHAAERVDNNTWRWSYAINDVYSAKLEAYVENDSIELTMYITKAGDFTDIVWFDGKCDILRTGGYWTIYDVPDGGTNAWLSIEWNADYEEETFDIRYTVVMPENDYEGSYIEYGITTNTDYNAYYDIYDSFGLNMYNVLYNTTTHVGSVTVNGTNRFCWDSSHNNCLCPGLVAK